MSEAFTRIGANKAVNSKGFSVQVIPTGGILYCDVDGEIRIDSEWLVKPPRILLYKMGFKMEQSEVDNMFSSVVKALEFLGHKIEIWSTPSGPDKQQPMK